MPGGGRVLQLTENAHLARRELRRRRLGDDPGRIARRGNDAVAIYFLDATLAAAFVTRWCAGSKVEISEWALRVREDWPMPHAEAGAHRTL
jgi:hypothetical protein